MKRLNSFCFCHFIALYLTYGIVHAEYSGFQAFVARKKSPDKLIGNCSVIPHDTIP